MNDDVYNVLLVSSNRTLLRQMSELLEQYGYRVTACHTLDDVQRLLQTEWAHFLLVDAAALPSLERLADWRAADSHQHVQTLLLAAEQQTLNVQDAFDLGVDDVIRLPASTAELLARLRAAARYAEFERRWNLVRWDDPLTGLLTASALDEYLARLWQDGNGPSHVALMQVQLDYFTQLQQYYGRRTGQQLCAAAGKIIQHAAGEDTTIAYFPQARYGLLLEGTSSDSIDELAEAIRTSIAEMDIEPLEIPVKMTASIGIALATDVRSGDELLQRAEGALRRAQQSGHDLTCWADEGSSGNEADEAIVRARNRFATSQARDVMTPFTAFLRPSDSVAWAAELFASTRLPVLPVIASPPAPSAVILREQVLPDTSGSDARRIEQLKLRELPRVAEDTCFVTVLEYFMNKEVTLLLVMRDDTLLGFIERASFSSLLKPLTPSLLHADFAAEFPSERLIVGTPQ